MFVSRSADTRDEFWCWTDHSSPFSQVLSDEPSAWNPLQAFVALRKKNMTKWMLAILSVVLFWSTPSLTGDDPVTQWMIQGVTLTLTSSFYADDTKMFLRTGPYVDISLWWYETVYGERCWHHHMVICRQCCLFMLLKAHYSKWNCSCYWSEVSLHMTNSVIVTIFRYLVKDIWFCCPVLAFMKHFKTFLFRK